MEQVLQTVVAVANSLPLLQNLQRCSRYSQRVPEECVDARNDTIARLDAVGMLEHKMNSVIDELVDSGSVDKDDIFKRVENIKLMDEVSIKEAKEIAKAKAEPTPNKDKAA